MAEYIDREKMLKHIEENNSADEWIVGQYNADWIYSFIENQPTADVQEIKHGYWIDKPTGRYCHIGSYCSVCEEKSGIGGIESNRHKPYCPNCGARMDGTPKERGGEK